VAVIGAGAMGSGIAQVFAQSGVPVCMVGRSEQGLSRAKTTIDRSWNRALEKGKIAEEAVRAAQGLLTTGSEIRLVSGADLIIEAIAEDIDVKRALFEELSGLLAPESILASNTSSISITRLAASTSFSDRVVGMHFFNPVPIMQLVEVVRGLQTSDETVRRVTVAAQTVGKTPVEVNDFPGFVSNRVLLPMINEAIFCLGEGVATKEAIDEVMKLGMAHPMGPLALADLIGLDVCLDILEVLHRDFGDDKYRPAPLLRKLVAAGKLGRKSGEGFFPY
jgi:3-hydroxybutyryl-CoA dehydrogenase